MAGEQPLASLFRSAQAGSASRLGNQLALVIQLHYGDTAQVLRPGCNFIHHDGPGEEQDADHRSYDHLSEQEAKHRESVWAHRC